MTKKEWYKLKFQVVMRIPSTFYLVHNETGWCSKCKHKNRSDCRGCRSIQIPVVDHPEDIIWLTGFYPLKFDD